MTQRWWAMPERSTMEGLGLWTTGYLPEWGSRTLDTHAQWFSPCLYNETLIKTLNLGWAALVVNALYVLSYAYVLECWCVLTLQTVNNGSFTSGTFPGLSLCISPWFGLVSFCYTKILIMSIAISWILGVILVNLNLRSHRNPKFVASQSEAQVALANPELVASVCALYLGSLVQLWVVLGLEVIVLGNLWGHCYLDIWQHYFKWFKAAVFKNGVIGDFHF